MQKRSDGYAYYDRRSQTYLQGRNGHWAIANIKVFDNIMKTIVIQLLKSMVLPEEQYSRIRYFGDTMENYAPEGVYDYYILGGKTIMATLNSGLLTSDLIPML